jgi:hypothetical protein
MMQRKTGLLYRYKYSCSHALSLSLPTHTKWGGRVATFATPIQEPRAGFLTKAYDTCLILALSLFLSINAAAMFEPPGGKGTNCVESLQLRSFSLFSLLKAALIAPLISSL